VRADRRRLRARDRGRERGQVQGGCWTQRLVRGGRSCPPSLSPWAI
jgi:hypothetical protein